MSTVQPTGDLDHLFNLALDMFCVAGFDGYFKRLSPSWERTLGFSGAELMSKPYLEFIHPDDVKQTIAAAAQTAAGDKVIHFRNRFLAKDGTYRWFSWNAVPFAEQKLVYAVARDITEFVGKEVRQAAAYAVTRVLATAPTLDAAAPEILRAVCEGLNWSVGSIWSVDPDAGVIRCIRVWHMSAIEAPEFSSMTQRVAFPPGVGLPGRVWQAGQPHWVRDVVADSNFPRAIAALHEGLHGAFGFPIRGGTGVIGVIEFFSPEIREPDADILAMFDAIGSQIGLFIERRSAEEKLQLYAQELEVARRQSEEATKAKSDFLANMSHEIRTPMNAIIGMTELTLLSKLTRQQQEHLQTVKIAADSLLNVLNDILDLSKIEARKLNLENVEFSIRSALDETAGLLALRAGEKGLELACHVSANTPDRVIGDPTRLRQIVLNLAGNAIKFTEQGEVLVRSELENISNGHAHVRFEVSDTGIGIPEDKRELIFEAFAQADSSTTRRYGGTGLGLAISSELVQLMGGRISLESTVGKGSVFRFTIPFSVAKGKPERIVEAMPNLEGLRVLAVDDNATNRQILKEILENWRMTPAVTDSAASALDILNQASKQKTPFSLVILDGHMPEIDGFTLAAKVRRSPALSKTRIIMLTSAADPADFERCRKIRASHLNKPVRQSELRDAIAKMFPGRTVVRRRDTRAARDAGSPKLRILVAEDNPTNQVLLEELLRRRGHTVKVTGNGKEALEAFSKGRFDIVLMDVQMPVLGGLDATASIRKRETGSGKRIPIVGTSAHAMASARNDALAVGMDEYLVKPIHANELYEMIDRLTGNEPGSQIDEESLVEGVGGNRRLLQKLATIFLKDAPRMMSAIRKAAGSGNGMTLAAASHALKGAAGNFGQNAVFRAARELEQTGKTNQLEEVPALLERLERNLTNLRTQLKRL